MSNKNVRPGSALEKEIREKKIVIPILAVITLLLLAVQFIIPSEYRDAVKYTDTWLNVIGGLLTGGSIVPLIMAWNAGEEGSSSYALAWVIMLAIGFLLAAVQAL